MSSIQDFSKQKRGFSGLLIYATKFWVDEYTSYPSIALANFYLMDEPRYLMSGFFARGCQKYGFIFCGLS